MTRRVARVLLDSPLPQLDRIFDYAVPADLGDIRAGVRVRVPLRTAGRVIDGYVVELTEEPDASRALSELDAITSDVIVLPSTLYTLARQVADRAAGSASDVLRLVIPKRQVRVEKAWRPVTDAPNIDAAALARAEAIIKMYDGLSGVLEERERAAIEARPALDDALPAWTTLLAAMAARTVADGASAILVVPDRRDIDRVLESLALFVPRELIVRQDSGQTNPDRYRGFLRMLDGTACIVVGNRSAVYAPVAAGLVAIWDDGDSLLSEPLAPYVHARDAALVRQGQEGSALCFVAHTRTTDVERLVVSGWLRDVHLTRRELPRVVLSTSGELSQQGVRIPSSAFAAARDGLENGPVLVQVARPGYAPAVVCGECRVPARCRTCGGPLGASHRGAIPTCGWCGSSAAAWRCPSCNATTFRLASSGSERTADELGRAFPGVRVIVADSAHPVERVSEASALVIATRGAEPIADGGYRAVVLLDGARMLQAPDLRIGESCLRWWSNAAALAAPGAPVHLVGVDGPVAKALATWTQPGYARAELSARAPLHMPPTVRVAQVEGTAEGVERGLQALAPLGLPAGAVLGPVPVESDSPAASGRVRALVRFGYSAGSQVATALRAAVIAQAVQRPRGRGRGARTTLSVRFDVLEPEL